MSKILICQHVGYEPLGTLDPLFRDRGFRLRYVNFSREPQMRPSIDSYKGLVILGGPMCLSDIEHYPHLAYEIEMVKKAIQMDIPILGICLGAQIIAKALGADVLAHCEKEIGWYNIELTEEGKQDQILSNFRHQEKIFQWHGDTFAIPPQATHLAYSSTCRNQAFRYGDKVYGFQFHLEVDQAMITRWLNVPSHIEEIKALNGKIDSDEIKQETVQYIEHSKQLSRQTFGEFIKLLGLKKRRTILRSK